MSPSLPPTADWLTLTTKKIHSSFLLFDPQKKGLIPSDEVPTLLRYLGIYPSESDIVKVILRDMTDDVAQVFVKYEKFEEVAIKLLTENTYPPDHEDILLTAFRTIDTENLGYIEWDRMKDIITSIGQETFREKEVEGFMSVAREGESGRVYYEDYIAILMGVKEGNEA